MRIGISCYPTHGGSGIIATELGKHLAYKGHEVAFISYDTPIRLSEIPPRVSFHEVEVVGYPLLKNFPYTLALASKMADVAEMKKLEILHVHYAIPFGAAAILASQIVPHLKLKIVTTLHGTDVTLVGNNPSFRPVTSFTLEYSDAVTAVSSFLKDQTYNEFNIDKSIDVIYNFIDADRHGKIPSCITKFDRTRLATLMHISNFRMVKRLRDVIRIFAQVLRNIPSRLLLIGDGPETGAALEEARALNVVDHVQFIGLVDDVVPFLRAADVFLLPSQSESFGLVALEALATGVPVIGSDVGGLPEVVEHNKNGFLAPIGDTSKMAEYTVRILSDPELFTAFGASARKRARDIFDYRKIIPRYEAVYERILKD